MLTRGGAGAEALLSTCLRDPNCLQLSWCWWWHLPRCYGAVLFFGSGISPHASATIVERHAGDANASGADYSCWVVPRAVIPSWWWTFPHPIAGAQFLHLLGAGGRICPYGTVGAQLSPFRGAGGGISPNAMVGQNAIGARGAGGEISSQASGSPNALFFGARASGQQIIPVLQNGRVLLEGGGG